MKMKIVACCIMAALQQCCLGQGGGGGGFGGLMGAAQAGPQVTTTGTVFDPSGNPDPNARLTVWQSSRAIARTNADTGGKYSIQWQAPAPRANAAQIKSTLFVGDEARNFAATRELDETNTRVDLRLVEGLSLSGSVKDTGGKALTGIEVRMSTVIAAIPTPFGRTLTDAQGSFNFKGLPQGEDYNLVVNIPVPRPVTNSGTGFTSVQSGEVTAGDRDYGCDRAALPAKDALTNHYAFPAFVLKKADRKISGYVFDGGNNPLSGATLSIVGEGQPPFPRVTTDQHGHFALEGVCEGPLKISVVTVRLGPGGGVTTASLNADNGQAIRAGDTNLVLKLEDKQPDTKPDTNMR